MPARSKPIFLGVSVACLSLLSACDRVLTSSYLLTPKVSDSVISAQEFQEATALLEKEPLLANFSRESCPGEFESASQRCVRFAGRLERCGLVRCSDQDMWIRLERTDDVGVRFEYGLGLSRPAAGLKIEAAVLERLKGHFGHRAVLRED